MNPSPTPPPTPNLPPPANLGKPMVLPGLTPFPGEKYFHITEAQEMFPALSDLVITVLPFTWIRSLPLVPPHPPPTF